ncbi:MAG: HipA domain-containing protein, partial [Deltaproteobacteria bacterium]|nr:HipA domain-containing protein [Deltaproteobacteria bacterium]
MTHDKRDSLSVFWGKDIVGTLRRLPVPGRLSFLYDRGWLQSGGPGISLSLPLSEAEQDPETSSNFFSNLLPEGMAYVVFTLMKHIPQGDTFTFLARYGRECAGALCILPQGKTPDDSPVDYRDITSDLESLLALSAKTRVNLMAATNAKVSLAGAQDKLPVLYDSGRFLVPAESSPAATTHIIKAPTGALPDVQYNESACLALAKAIGLPVPNARIINIGGVDVLLVERYDRTAVGGSVYRIHQEDFCQAAGVSSQLKYQENGGPGFARCADVARGLTDTAEAIDDLARIAIFNLIIGNCGAHAKNLSLLYDHLPELDHRGPGMRMAPFYDLLC